jgi:hypothetical protein
MRRILIASVFGLVVALAGPALAGVQDVLAANTPVLTDSADKQTAYLLGAGGQFTETGSGGKQAHGAWPLNDGRLCLAREGRSTALRTDGG